MLSGVFALVFLYVLWILIARKYDGMEDGSPGLTLRELDNLKADSVTHCGHEGHDAGDCGHGDGG